MPRKRTDDGWTMVSEPRVSEPRICEPQVSEPQVGEPRKAKRPTSDGFFSLSEVLELIVYATLTDYHKKGDIYDWYFHAARCADYTGEVYALKDGVPPLQVLFQVLELQDMHGFLERYRDLSISVIGGLKDAVGTVPTGDAVEAAMRRELRAMYPYVVSASDDAEMALVGMEGAVRGTIDDRELARLAETVDVHGCTLIIEEPEDEVEASRLAAVAATQDARLCMHLAPGPHFDAVMQAIASCDAVEADEDEYDLGDYANEVTGEIEHVTWRTAYVTDLDVELPASWDWVVSVGVEETTSKNREGKELSREVVATALGLPVTPPELSWLLDWLLVDMEDELLMSFDVDMVDARDLRWLVGAYPKRGRREVRKYRAHENRLRLKEDLEAIARQLGEKGTAVDIHIGYARRNSSLPTFLFAELPLAFADGRVSLS